VPEPSLVLTYTINVSFTSYAAGYLSTARKRFQGIFLGWWTVAITCVLTAINQGLLNQGFTLYVLPLQDEFHWSKAMVSSGYSLNNIETGLLDPVGGWLTDRFGPRRVVAIGVLILGAGFIILSSVHSIPMFYCAFLVMAAGASLSGFLPLSVAVLKWFVRKRGLALGIAQAGGGLAGLIVPLVAWSITTHGWRLTALVSAFIIWGIGIPLSMLLKQAPEKYGLLPDGDKPSVVQEKQTDTSSEITAQIDAESFTVREALKTRAFWFIGIGHSLAVFGVSAVSLHLAPHLVLKLGLSLQAAGAVAASLLVTSVVSRILGGYLGDRFNKRVLLVSATLAHVVGLLILAFATNLFQVALFVLIHGMAWGIRGTVQSAIRADYFGRKSIGLILGLGSIIVAVSNVSAPIFAGWLADVRGNYTLAFTITAIVTAAGAFFFGFASKPTRKPRISPGQTSA
jgi:MFS family permease